MPNVKSIYLSAQLGVAVREFPTGTGPADYMLFANGNAIGIVEAKKAGGTLNGTLATDDQTTYPEVWQSVDSDEGVPLAVVKRVFGKNPKTIIEELNEVLNREHT